MCGIAGIYNSPNPEADHAVALQMAEAIASRGPDACAVKNIGSTTFAHRRLAIIDLNENAEQPMCDLQDNCMISFNGEIYNYPELRSQLLKQGATFQTSGDTEVILQLYLHGGVEALSQLDGMFAFAICDYRTRELILMRDRLGKKPLYYFETPDKSIVFASTLPALKKHPRWQGEIRTEAIHDFLAYCCVPGDESVYRNVFSLPAASIMRCSADGRKVISKYWQLDYSNKLAISFEDAAEELQNKLADAVRKRLISDVPCGLFLSGGVDSGAVSMLAAQQSSSVIDAFTIGFSESCYDERPLAEKTVKWINSRTAYGIAHHTQIVDCRSFEELKKLAASCGEPFADLSILPTALLSRFAANKVKLVLSGDGADEIFGGYERYIAMQYCARLEKILPRAVLRMLAAAAGTIFPNRGKRSTRSRLIRFLTLAAAPASQRYVLLMTQATEASRRALYGEKLQSGVLPDAGSYLNNILTQTTTCDPAERYAECDLHSYLVNDILVKTDRASMAHSLEIRSPFLDKEVVEFAAKLPFDFKQHKGKRKLVLRKALQDLIAPEISGGRKRGFAVPVGSWFRNEWKDLLAEHLLQGELIRGGWMNKKALTELINAHNTYKQDHSELLGSLLMLELFLQTEK